MQGPQKTTLRLKLEALEIGDKLVFADEHETKLAQFISWELRKKFGRKFKRRGLEIVRLDDGEIANSSNAYFVVLWQCAKTSFEGPFDSKSDATGWLTDYQPDEPGRNGEPEFGMVLGPLPTKMFREF